MPSEHVFQMMTFMSKIDLASKYKSWSASLPDVDAEKLSAVLLRCCARNRLSPLSRGNPARGACSYRKQLSLSARPAHPVQASRLPRSSCNTIAPAMSSAAHFADSYRPRSLSSTTAFLSSARRWAGVSACVVPMQRPKLGATDTPASSGSTEQFKPTARLLRERKLSGQPRSVQSTTLKVSLDSFPQTLPPDDLCEQLHQPGRNANLRMRAPAITDFKSRVMAGVSVRCRTSCRGLYRAPSRGHSTVKHWTGCSGQAVHFEFRSSNTLQTGRAVPGSYQFSTKDIPVDCLRHGLCPSQHQHTTRHHTTTSVKSASHQYSLLHERHSATSSVRTLTSSNHWPVSIS